MFGAKGAGVSRPSAHCGAGVCAAVLVLRAALLAFLRCCAGVSRYSAGALGELRALIGALLAGARGTLGASMEALGCWSASRCVAGVSHPRVSCSVCASRCCAVPWCFALLRCCFAQAVQGKIGLQSEACCEKCPLEYCSHPLIKQIKGSFCVTYCQLIIAPTH
jgi:hypothetical protein